MTALLNDYYEDLVIPEGVDILDMGWIDRWGVTIVNARDIVVTPYLTLNLAKAQMPTDTPLNQETRRVPLLRGPEGALFALGGFDVLKAALAGANSSLIQCDIYTLAEASYERPDVFGAFVTIQDCFHGEENELWSYVNLVDRSDWDTAETFRQPLRLVQTMRKASRLFKAEGVAQPASWDQALEQIVMNFPAAWDEDFAYCSEGHFVDGQDQTNYLLMMCRAAAAVEEPPKGVGLAGFHAL